MPECVIEEISVFTIDLPYSNGTYTLSSGREYTKFDSTVVRITTANGIEGWGESTPFGATFVAAHGRGVRAGIEEIAPNLIGQDPRRVDRINEIMDGALMGHEHAKAALDIACWDIFGKSVGLPVCELMGGSTEIGLPLISSIHVAEPADMRRQVSKYRKQGYLGHSVKVSGDPVKDAERIKASLADKEADEFFIVDANCGLSVETALRLLRLLPENLDFVLEAPCSTLRETTSLRRRTNVPIYIDELAISESSVIKLIAEDAAEGINIKISKNGGLTRSRRLRDLCITAGYTFSVQDTVGSDISFAAIVHFAQTVPEKNLRCILDPRKMVTVRTAHPSIDVVEGRVIAPKLPGLGITPNLSVLGRPVASYR